MISGTLQSHNQAIKDVYNVFGLAIDLSLFPLSQQLPNNQHTIRKLATVKVNSPRKIKMSDFTNLRQQILGTAY